MTSPLFLVPGLLLLSFSSCFVWCLMYKKCAQQCLPKNSVCFYPKNCFFFSFSFFLSWSPRLKREFSLEILSPVGQLFVVLFIPCCVTVLSFSLSWLMSRLPCQSSQTNIFPSRCSLFLSQSSFQTSALILSFSLVLCVWFASSLPLLMHLLLLAFLLQKCLPSSKDMSHFEWVNHSCLRVWNRNISANIISS